MSNQRSGPIPIPINDAAKNYLKFLVRHADDAAGGTVPTCALCLDRGFIPEPGQPVAFAPMLRCPACNAPGRRMIERCYAIGDLSRDATHAPTFQSFRKMDGGERECAAMLDAAEQYAAQPYGWLVLHGNGRHYGTHTDDDDIRAGSGKSHLAEAIVRDRLAQDEPWLFITAPKLFRYLGAVKRDEETDYDARLRWVVDLPGLCIDDLGTESHSEFVQRVRFELLNARYVAATRGQGGATIITSNYHPDHWPDRIGSRANDARWTQVLASPIDVRQFELD